MNVPITAAPKLPFSLAAIPQRFPLPNQLQLWVVEIN